MENGQSELASSRIMWARGTPRDTKINGNRLDSTHRALAHQLLSGSQDSQCYPNHYHNTYMVEFFCVHSTYCSTNVIVHSASWGRRWPLLKMAAICWCTTWIHSDKMVLVGGPLGYPVHLSLPRCVAGSIAGWWSPNQHWPVSIFKNPEAVYTVRKILRLVRLV